MLILRKISKCMDVLFVYIAKIDFFFFFNLHHKYDNIIYLKEIYYIINDIVSE